MTKKKVLPIIRRAAARALAIASLALAVLTSGDALGQTSGREFPGFRFWKAPESAIERWPWGNEKYLPIKTERFNEWLRALDEENRRQEYLDGKRIVEGVAKLKLSANLVGDSLQGVGEITSQDFAFDETNDPDATLFPIPELSFAVSFDEYGETARLEDQIATYPDRNLYLPTTRKGARAFTWSKRGTTRDDGSIQFELKFPAATDSELELVASDDVLVTVSDGAIGTAMESNGESNKRIWRAYLGGRSSVVVTASPKTNDLENERRKTGYRQELNYRVAVEGVELASKWRFENANEPIGEVEIEFDDPLVMLAVEWGDARLDKFPVPKREEKLGVRKIAIRAPAPGPDGALPELKVSAFCNLEFTRRRLPCVRIVPQNAVWRESLCRLTIADPLEPTYVEPVDAVQTRDATRARQEDSNALAFKFFNPNASVLLEIENVEASAPFDSATDCLFVENGISAKTTLFFNFADANRRTVAVPIAKDWAVDSVQTPQGDDCIWKPEADPERDGCSMLHMAFKNPPTPNQPTRVSIAARYQGEIGDKILVDSLRPIDLSDALLGAHALALRSDSASQVQLATKTGRPFVASKNKPNFIFGEAQLREATTSAAGVARLYFGDQTVGLYASLERARNDYAVDPACNCAISDRALTETWNLHCAPAEGMRVDRVVFFVSPKTVKSESYEGTISDNLPWTWSTATEPERVNYATALSREEADALRAPENADAYEIKLPSSRSVPFDLKVFYETPNAPNVDLPLLFFPEASQESAEFVLASNSDQPFKTTTVAMIESTPPVLNSTRYGAQTKAFRYRPTELFTTIENDPEGKESLLENDAVPKISVELLASRRSREELDNLLPYNALCWFESYDSYYQKDGDVDHCASFYIENRGRDYLRFYLERATSEFNVTKQEENEIFADGSSTFDEEERLTRIRNLILVPKALDATQRAIRAVWIDDQRAEWFMRNVDSESKEKILFEITVRIPTNQKFVCLEIEYAEELKQPIGGMKLKPFEVRCEAPVLSGVWTAWTPPQYVTRDRQYLRRASSAPKNWLRAIRNLVKRSSKSEQATVELAELVAERLGDPFTLKTFISDAREADAQAQGRDPNALVAPRLDPPTWGDLFGSPAFAEKLFYREDAKETPSLRVDQFALARIGIAPSTPAPLDAMLTPSENLAVRRENAARLLADAGIVLLFLEEKLALVTTDDALALWSDLDAVSVQGRSIRRARENGDALAISDELLNSNSRRFVSPEKWRAMVGGTSPWISRSHTLEAKGWERAAAPIGRAHEGVYFVNRYRLATLALVSFLAALAFGRALWRLDPRYLIALAGVSCATLFVAHYELASIAKGALWGALAILFWGLFQSAASSEPNDEEPKDEQSHGSSSVVLPSDDSQSLSGFVDFNHMPDDVAEYLRAKAEEASLQNGGAENGASAPERAGKTSSAILAALLAVASALAAATFAIGQEETVGDRDGALSPQGAIQTLDGLFPLSNAAVQSSESSNAPNWREPYRVFVPYDANGDDVGEYYWISDEFYEYIRNALRSRPRERNWRVVDALYSGDISYNSFSKTTSVYRLKATYLVVMDEEKAAITLPAVQLSANGGAKFDGEVVAVEYDGNASEMSIEVGGKPGKHTLELSLEPSIFIETASRITAPILPVASARLELNVDLDAPTLDAPNALGAITRTPRKFSAQLGPVDALIIEKKENLANDAKSSLDVEQYFLMRPRPTQTDVRAAFKFQTVGGKVEYVDIECDPAYSFSGFCKCDAAEIASIEAPTAQNEAMRVVFKNPAPAAFTLNVDFVARDFAGVGALPIPAIRTKDARVLKNWLAFADAQGVELQIDESGAALETEFLNAWGSDDEVIERVYDLAVSKVDAFVVRLKQELPKLEEDVVYVFRPSYVETQYVADIESEAEIFQMTFATPKPFVVDSVAVYDDQGAELDAPNFVASNDKLRLEFGEPLRGKRTINIVGRTKETVEQEQAFPVVRARDVEYVKRTARLYASPNLYVEWLSIPKSWGQIERDLTLEPVGEDVYPVELYSIASENTEQAENQTNDEEDAPKMRVVMNAPAAQGLERVALYPEGEFARQEDGRASEETPVWKALYSLVFKPIEGRFDRMLVRADEQFEIDPLPTDSIFKVREAVDLNGARAYVFEPKRTTVDNKDEEYCLMFTSTFRGEQENLRLPNYQLAASPLLEDYSKVTRKVLLATQQKEQNFSWNTRGLAPESASAQRKLTKGVSKLAQNGANSIVGSNNPDQNNLPSERDAQTEDDDPTENEDADQAENQDVPPKSDAELAVLDYLKILDKNGVGFSVFARAADADANLSARGAKLEVALAQHSFYINDRREIFGLVSFFIQPGERDLCELIAPPKCHVLEASVNGARRLVERQVESADENENADNAATVGDENGETRWFVDLGGSPYAKRLVVAFYSEPSLGEKVDPRLAQRRAEEFNVDFVRIADAQINRIVWTCAFEDYESSALDAKWFVRASAANSSATKTIERQPASVDDASPALQRLAMLDASVILDAYESDSARLANALADDKSRLSERWIAALERLEDSLAQYADDPRQNLEFDDALARAVATFDAEDDRNAKNGKNESPERREKTNETFPIPDWRAKFGDPAAMRERVAAALKKERGTNGVNRARDSYSVSPETLWTLENSANARVLFGSANVELLSLAVVATPKPFDFFASSYAVALFILMATAFVLQLIAVNSAARVRRGVIFALVMLLWTVLFFYLDQRFVATVGAFLGVLLSALTSNVRRRAKVDDVLRDDDEEEDDERLDDDSLVDRDSSDDDVNSTSCDIVEPVSQMGRKDFFARDDSSNFQD